MKRDNYDLIIIGGGIASSFLALSIYKLDPDFQVLILEKSKVFPQKIGESLVDLSALYVKSLGIDHLLSKHTHKTGIRFLFNESNSAKLSRVAEFASPTLPGLIKGYHLDRKLFDQQLLDEVQEKGAIVLRPAHIIQASFEDFNNELDIEVEGKAHYVRSRWLVDASGRSRYIPQQLNWADKHIELNTGAIMAHFTHIAPEEAWDTPHKDYWDTHAVGLRAFSTTHLMRKHAWWWIIRLDEKTTSIGMVFDKEHVQFDDYQEFFLQQIAQDAQLSVICEGAQRGTIRHVPQLPYVCKKLYDKGIALIGESGAFLDPLISPGIELIAQQTLWLARLFTREKASGTFKSSAWERYSNTFYKAYDSRLRIYKPAYDYMHSYDIFSAWLMQGNVMYFGKTIYPAALFPHKLKDPLTFNFIERLALQYFKMRFRAINRKRRRHGRISKTQAHEISYSGVRVPANFRIILMPFVLLFKALWAYAKLEGAELRHSFSRNSKSELQLRPEGE